VRRLLGFKGAERLASVKRRFRSWLEHKVEKQTSLRQGWLSRKNKFPPGDVTVMLLVPLAVVTG